MRRGQHSVTSTSRGPWEVESFSNQPNFSRRGHAPQTVFGPQCLIVKHGSYHSGFAEVDTNDGTADWLTSLRRCHGIEEQGAVAKDRPDRGFNRGTVAVCSIHFEANPPAFRAVGLRGFGHPNTLDYRR
jgi:hypothetical protein